MPDVVHGGGPLHQFAETLVTAKQQLSETGAYAKSHTAALAARADGSAPAYAAGARPGTAVALVAGCLAIGGGATYCAVDGLPDPIRSFAQTEPQASDTQEGRAEGPVKDEIPVEVEPTPQPEPPPAQVRPGRPTSHTARP